MIKVLIADDSSIQRNGIKTIIEQDSEIEVVGCAGNGQEAFEMCNRLLPNIVLMDIRMPVCDGVEGTRRIKSKYDSVKIIILTTFNDDQYISEALKYGANGYLLKDIEDDDLLRTIKSTVKGYTIVQQGVFESVLNHCDLSIKKNTTGILHETAHLTDREKEIIRLIVDGKNNREIASTLYIVEGTVRNMISAILEKLKLKDRTQLAVFAIKTEIV